MSINTYADLEVTPSNNQNLLNNNITGGANANTLDTIVQSFAGMTARFYGDVGGLGTVGGSANAITLTSLSTYQSLEDGMWLSLKAGSANSGPATLNLDGLGVRAIRRKGDVALEAGDMAAGGRYLLFYDATYNTAAGAWVLMNPESIGAATTSTLTNKTITTPTLTLKQSAAPAPTAEGDIQWDSDDNRIVVGNGTDQTIFYPTMSLLGTLTTTSGSTTSAVTIPAGFRKLYIEIEGVSVSTGSPNFRLELSSNGGSGWGTPGVIRVPGGGADTMSGWVEVGGITSADANAKILLSLVSISGGGVSTPDSYICPTNTAARANAIRFSSSSGSFDAGTIRVYGVP